MADLTAPEKKQLQDLWLAEGGLAESVREFHALCRRRGLEVSFAEVSKWLRELGLLPEVERRLEALWAERQSSTKELYDRARAAAIPVTYLQIDKFVREAPKRTLEAFQAPRQTGKAYANDLDEQWQADVIYMTTRPSPPYMYILFRINAFSREIDAEPMETNTGEDVAAALEKMLRRASVRPKILLTDAGGEFQRPEVQRVLGEYRAVHEVKEPGDHGTFSVTNSTIASLKLRIRTEATDKDIPWAEALPELVRQHNSRPNHSSGVKPRDVAPAKPTAAQKERSEEAQFWLSGQYSEAIQHNFKEQERRKEAIAKAGGVRLRLAKDDGPVGGPVKRRGPRPRVDDPTYGDTQRVVPDDFTFGQVRTQGGDITNLKLAIPSVPAAATSGPLPRDVNDELSGLRTRLLDHGPQRFEEVARAMREALGDKLERHGGLLRILRDRGFSFEKGGSGNAFGWVFLSGAFEDDGVKYIVKQQPRAMTPAQLEIQITGIRGVSDKGLKLIRAIENAWFIDREESYDPSEQIQRARRWGARGLSDADLESLRVHMNERDERVDGGDPLTTPWPPAPDESTEPLRPGTVPRLRDRPVWRRLENSQDILLRELWTQRTSAGETWAEALANRPPEDFYIKRPGRGGSMKPATYGVLHAELLAFLRGLTGRAAEPVAAILGYPPGAHYAPGGPTAGFRLQRVNLALLRPLIGLARQSVATSYF